MVPPILLGEVVTREKTVKAQVGKKILCATVGDHHTKLNYDLIISFVGSVAQWLGWQSLTGRLSLPCAPYKPVDR